MKKKSVVAIIAALALTAVLSVGGTLAYLSTVTETHQNTFTSTKNITTNLTETEWTDSTGKDYTPGKEINKNPVMTNTSTADSIYVAVKLGFVNSDGKNVDYATFQKYASIVDLDTTDWIKIGTYTDGSELWAYAKETSGKVAATALASSTSTNAIFTKVKVNAGLSSEWTTTAKTEKIYTVDAQGNKTLVSTTTTNYDPTIKYYDENGNLLDAIAVATGSLPEFRIDVTGYAVQATDTDGDTGITNLKALAGLV